MIKNLMVGATMVLLGAACAGPAGAEGQTGPAGAEGAPGKSGTSGTNGSNGEGGASGVSSDGGGANGTDALTSFTSGMRIKARVTTTTTTTTDGAKYSTSNFAGWTDSATGEACSSVITSDGKRRCTPAAPAPYTYFVDSACAVPVVVVYNVALVPACGGAAPSSAPPKYVGRTATTMAGCSATQIALVGAKITTYTNQYVKNGAACSSLGAAPTYYDYYDASGPEIDPTTFAEFTTTTTTM